MTCHDVSAVIDAYLDGELGVDDVADVTRHLDACASCRRQLDDRKALSVLLRRLPYYDAPPALATTLIRKERALSSSRRVQWWMAAAASIVIAAGTIEGLRSVRRAQQTSALAEAVIERHVSALAEPSLIQVQSSDQHTVKPWFQGKLEFSPPVPDLTRVGFELVGGRIDRIGGRAAAALVYKRRLHVIHVFVWPGGDGARVDDARTIRGFHERHWTSGDLSVWAISDVNDEDLRTFADDFAISR
jgi:anti-sigma factor (TIGR02949 family)